MMFSEKQTISTIHQQPIKDHMLRYTPTH